MLTRVAHEVVGGSDVGRHHGHAQNGVSSGSDSSFFHAAKRGGKILVAHKPLLGGRVRVHYQVRQTSWTDIDSAWVVMDIGWSRREALAHRSSAVGEHASATMARTASDIVRIHSLPR